MQSVLSELSRRFAAALRAASGLPDVDPGVRVSGQEKFGDYQVNGVMAVARRLGRPGPELAHEVLRHLHLDDLAGEVTVAGPGFINVRLAEPFLRCTLTAMARDERLGIDPAETPETIVVDFSSPNVAKEMHVGHIRSTIIGDALCRIFEFLGHRVHRINHVGDWGTQFGMLIQYLRRSEPEVVRGTRQLEVADLEEFYRKAKEAFDSDVEFREAARQEVVRLQQGDPESLRAWEAICHRSRVQFQEIYDALGVRIREQGESFYNPLLPEVVEDLLGRGIATESEGAVCVFDENWRSPFIVRKRDGGYLYATTDLAALRYRVKVLRATRIIYVTDARQRDHFQQLFATARRAGYAPAGVRLEHVAFGSVLGPDGTPLKTREGRAVRLKEVIEEAVQRARRLVAAKRCDLPGAEQERIGRIVGIGALKYADLSQNPGSDYVFDWDRMLALEGDTAPYLQYAYARICSIFRKGGYDLNTWRYRVVRAGHPAERRLAVWLLRYNEIVHSAARECRPTVICNFLYELATRFTGLYSDCPVLKAPAEVREGRLGLCGLAAKVLRSGLDLLGIETSERM